MKETDKNLPVTESNTEPNSFKGYTMEEIKYHRAMLALRKEFCKAKLMQSVDNFKPKRKEKASGTSKFKLATTIASKVFSNLNALDYVMMGISLFGTAKKGYNLIRKKK
ncbi:MAG: hypothetical protein HDS71_07145 [Bacteroidales bacterium]|nr:hypothetical protein [Bacteroidales bacterium]MBD5205829.1 hypothetical protein [Bacteroidales bacterium]MBD5223808.1 hypothetical protein [Bacteroidales bacterium]MBD5302363.1 hypothetical protein [Bacteroides sp.]MBD5348544.1 hypothetical protein [Bacteroides sp.]